MNRGENEKMKTFPKGGDRRQNSDGSEKPDKRVEPFYPDRQTRKKLEKMLLWPPLTVDSAGLHIRSAHLNVEEITLFTAA